MYRNAKMETMIPVRHLQLSFIKSKSYIDDSLITMARHLALRMGLLNILMWEKSTTSLLALEP